MPKRMVTSASATPASAVAADVASEIVQLLTSGRHDRGGRPTSPKPPRPDQTSPCCVAPASQVDLGPSSSWPDRNVPSVAARTGGGVRVRGRRGVATIPAWPWSDPERTGLVRSGRHVQLLIGHSPQQIAVAALDDGSCARPPEPHADPGSRDCCTTTAYRLSSPHLNRDHGAGGAGAHADRWRTVHD